uniref:Uncharacterized protein n=1 Tax=Anguilla anguilla TaxID=7936 RepID=A0A0E9QBM9_ANGAN
MGVKCCVKLVPFSHPSENHGAELRSSLQYAVNTAVICLLIGAYCR